MKAHKIIDLSTWERREHYTFFKEFMDPFYGITFSVDVTQAYKYCKSKEASVSKFMLFNAIKAANLIENFRYRIVDGKVVCFDLIHVNSVYLRKDKTFSFSYINYTPDFEAFMANAKKVHAGLEKTTGLGLSKDTNRLDSIHFSTLPWIDFSGLSHAKALNSGDSCPKISLGKITQQENKKVMPCSVHVHHGLVDGYHIGLFAAYYQNLLNGVEMG